MKCTFRTTIGEVLDHNPASLTLAQVHRYTSSVSGHQRDGKDILKMPITLPVPSKGALRTLRNLALGTSCTVAFSAGLLTEDRRRRINTAREIHDNAKKLKSSRKYHSTGTAVLDTFENQVMRFRDEGFWQAVKVSQKTEADGCSHAASLSDSQSKLAPQSSAPPFSVTRYELTHSHTAWISRLKSSERPSLVGSRDRLYTRQHKLANDIMRLLEGGTDPAMVDAAASRFFDAFEEGLVMDQSGITQALVDSTANLSRACRLQSKFEVSEKILDTILRYGPLDEEEFHLFSPAAIIDRLLSGSQNEGSRDSMIDRADLRKAAALYLTKFKEQPKVMTTWLQSLGERLCAATCRSEMYDLTLDLYWRLNTSRGDASPRAVEYLITAAHKTGDHEKILGYFQMVYTKTSPNQEQLYNVVGLVLDSVLKVEKADKAVEVLTTATQIAEAQGLLTSTTWLLKVLGSHWRSTRDISSTRALFERLAPLVPATRHPQAVYSAIIQFCVEANEEMAALSYHNRLRETYTLDYADVRIYGHFALAKAMRNDWTGVEEDFSKMKLLTPDENEYSASFTPILGLFAKSHTVKETEEFLRLFIDQHGVRLTLYMFNIMIDAYAQAREIDSVSRWIDYGNSVGCTIDVVSFNTILNNCYEKWNFSFQEAYKLYKSVQENGDLGAKYHDTITVSILRRIAIAESGDNIAHTLKELNHLKLGALSQNSMDSRGVAYAMYKACKARDWTEVLEQYRRAQSEKIPLHSDHLGLAVKASLRIHGENIEEPTNLVRDAQRNGLDISDALGTILAHQMSMLRLDCDAKTGHIMDFARNTISTLEAHGIDLPFSVLTHSVSVLERRGQYRHAIALWESMSHHRSIPPSSIDLVTLTVLLKAYIGLRSSVGITWVMDMLLANGLVPDTHFKVILKNTRNATSKFLQTSNYPDHITHYFKVVQQALKRVNVLRALARKDKEHVKLKTIQIIDQAIADQLARDGRSQETSPNLNKMGKDYEQHAASSTLDFDGEPRAALESGHDLGYNTPQRRSVSVAAG